MRSQAEPRGIATNDLARAKSLRLGKELLDFTIDIVRCCNEYAIPYVMENPLTSYAWHDESLKAALQQAEILDVHQCAFGARFRKATRLTFGNFNRMVDNKGW